MGEIYGSNEDKIEEYLADNLESNRDIDMSRIIKRGRGRPKKEGK